MGIFLEYLWHLALPLAVGIGLITALFYVQGTAKIIIRMALAGVVILCAQTILQGTWTERWRVRPVSEQEQALAARLKSVPFTVGNWDSDESKIDERGLEGSRTVGYYGRIFHNRDNPQQVVSVYVFCGHPRDMTQHTPDQCYPLNGNDAADDQQKQVVDAGKMSADFYTNCFHKSMAFEGPSQVRVFWSFSKDGHWVALPKFELLNSPALYKIYAISEVTGDGKSRPDDPAVIGFLREFLPVLNASLFPPQPAEPAADGEQKASEANAASS
jgi:hypothetical protein